MSVNSFGAKASLDVNGTSYEIFRLDSVPGSEKLPFSLKVLLENLLRTEDGANITKEDILSKSRKRNIVQARQIAMYLSRNMLKCSLSTIGAELGGKDHATVMHACSTVSDMMSTDRNFKKFVTDIERLLVAEGE